jgi:plasmid stabilization system protein ParE
MAVIVNWNGVDVPEELKGLKKGRYVLVPIDEPPELTEEQEAGLEDAIASIRDGRGVRLLERIREIVTLLAEGGLDGPRSTLRSGLEVHSWPIPPLRIYYRREPNAFHILRIYHQSRRPL